MFGMSAVLANYTGTKAVRFVLTLTLGAGIPGVIAACGGGTPQASGVPGAPLGSAAPTADPSAPTTSTQVPADAGTGRKLVATAEPANAGPEPGRGPNDIRNAVMAKRAEARACFDAVAKTKPGLEGNIVVKWLIDPKGAVKDVMIDPDKTTVPDQTIGACIIGVVSKLSFPPSAKHFETKAMYPFNFKANSQASDGPAPK